MLSDMRGSCFQSPCTCAGNSQDVPFVGLDGYSTQFLVDSTKELHCNSQFPADMSIKKSYTEIPGPDIDSTGDSLLIGQALALCCGYIDSPQVA